MSAKLLAAGVVVGLIVLGVGAYVITDDSATVNDAIPLPAQNDTSNPRTTQPAPVSEAPQTYTAQEVATHATADDCWTIIDGAVYDITSYIQRHPGGDEILLACGVDATTLFLQRETADGQAVGSGTPHSSNARRQLESLKVGELSE